MSDSWIAGNLESTLEMWNEKLAELWQLLTQSPATFKGGAIWNVMVNIHGALQALAYALMVLFFVVGVMKTCGSFADLKRPEHAVKLFIRFAITKTVISRGLELMLAILSIIQGVVASILSAGGIGGAQATVLPQEVITACEDTGFWESIPLWVVTLIGSLFVWVLAFVMILTVYGRFFKLYMYTAIAPVPLSTFTGEPSQNVGKSFLKSYAAVCLEGAVIVLACIIFSVFASEPPVVDTTADAANIVWSYIGGGIFVPYLKGRKKYAKLEQMSIEELEKLLALEMRLPEEDRDTEFYDEVEEVLLQKVSDTPEGRITEVEAAWKDFEKNYLPKVGAEEGKAVPKKITQSKMQHPRWGHLAVAAAMIVVIFSAMAIPSAFGAENLFTVIGRWTDSVFSFERDGTNTQSTAPFDVDSFPSDNADLRQLYIAVSSYIGDAQVIPTWMPESFILDSVTISPFADYQTIRARFLRDDAMITIQIVAMNNAADSASTQYEKDDAEVEMVTIDSIDYYLMKNESVWCCSWVNNNLECHIFGDITKEDLYKIINSIGGSTT